MRYQPMHSTRHRGFNVSAILRTVAACLSLCLATLVFAWPSGQTSAAVLADDDAQALAANAERLARALHGLGAPLAAADQALLEKAIESRDSVAIQDLLDKHVLVEVSLNPEARVKAAAGRAEPRLQQGGYTPVIIKVINDSTIKAPLAMRSPQAGPVVSGGRAGDVKAAKNHFLDVEMYTAAPLTKNLSGLGIEYALGLIHSSEAGNREATLVFDAGEGSKDLGARAEIPILFKVAPAVRVTMQVNDHDGSPSTGHFTFTDAAGRVYPPQAKRLAPDFFFQKQVYRHSGGVVLLPPGKLTMTYGRGPEYRTVTREVVIPDEPATTIVVDLQRWIEPSHFGFYSGDHHIHAAGCSHYTSPTEGVMAEDMFLHVKGEGLNVGCNLTWGPCYEYQRQFFEPGANKLSEPLTVLKYDIEVSGFGSQALGHVCLLNLKDQTYPGSESTKTKGWPTWTTPLMRWAKQQGAYTGYAHSANGLAVNPMAAAERLLAARDMDADQVLSMAEAATGLLPARFEKLDGNRDQQLDKNELTKGIQRVSQQLPNLAIPEMNGIGAQEICVTTAQGLCDFISAMDTERVPEWNCWYHLMNCGFPLKVSGETDFPCITDSRVGQGRVYVQLGAVDQIQFADWCAGLAAGRSYVSDGYAHALEFSVNERVMGETVELAEAGTVQVRAKVAFAAEPTLGTANGAPLPTGNTRMVELVVNGHPVATQEVPADDQPHTLSFEVPLERSSWVALRHFPQLHTNPVIVSVAGQPIRASRGSAQWCEAVIEQLWNVRETAIAESERAEAATTFESAKKLYRKIASESPDDS